MRFNSKEPQTGAPQVEEVSFDNNIDESPDPKTDRKGQETDRKLVDEKGPQRRKGYAGGEVELQARGEGVQALHKESVIGQDLP